MARRKSSPLVQCCIWHGRVILQRPISFANDRRLLREWKYVIEAANEMGVDILDVQQFMLDLHLGNHPMTGFQPWNEWAKKNKRTAPISPYHLLYSSPPGREDVNLLQAEFEVTDPPPCWDTVGFALYVRKFKERAIKSGKWSGVFPYTPFADPNESILPPNELEQLVGKEYVALSLERLKQVEKELA